MAMTAVHSSFCSGTLRNAGSRGPRWKPTAAAAVVGPVSALTTKAENGETPVHSDGDDRCPETGYHIFSMIDVG